MRKFWINQKGVTMIEVLVTIAILAIVVTPCLSAFVMAQRGNVKAAETQQAYTAAANLMEELKGVGIANVGQRLDNGHEVDGVRVNDFDGVHVIYNLVEGEKQYCEIWIYNGEGANKDMKEAEFLPQDYILKGVIAP
jgi:prepilin-type N-terminal cleavage/methylation domain-containing protein